MKSTAQVGALGLGVAFLLVGIAGFFVSGGTSMDADMATAGRLLGLFPINLLHNMVPIGGHIIWLHAVLALGLAWVGFFAAQPSTVRQG